MNILCMFGAALLACFVLLCPRALAAEPPVIGVFGDSLGDGVWSGLYPIVKAHPGVQLFRHSKLGSGLTRPDYDTWFGEFTKTLDAEHLTVAIVMFGANDEESIRDENHKGYYFMTEGWHRTYAARVQAILDALAKRKIRAIWLGLPVMRKDDFDKGADYLNGIFATSTKAAGGSASFLPLAEDFKGPDGRFTLYLADAKARQRQVRANDGVHFTGYGYGLVAEKVYAVIDPPAIAAAR